MFLTDSQYLCVANEGQHVNKKARVNQRREEELTLALGNTLNTAKNKSFFANTFGIL